GDEQGDDVGQPAPQDPTGRVGAPAGERRTLRPGSSVAVGAAGLAAALALLVPAALADPRPWSLIGSVVFGLVLLWLLVVRPSAVIADEGIRLVNPLRIVDISWPAVSEVRSRWVLEVVADGRRYAAWGVPAEPKRPRHGRGRPTLGAHRVPASSPAPRVLGARLPVGAQAVAAEIEARVAADRRRPDGGSLRVVSQAWDPVAVGLLLAGAACFVVTVLLA
ncbi:MAG TPA: PH domain-containing protein, partial [Intrasporangium sp.]|uniref:PH domain-containing protein n=1 Tax=Intrasporangium sp. TaxID=1925024 RepID=UPI002D76F1AB